jgi:ribosomal protein S18 acetylase RimI-like enzyme
MARRPRSTAAAGGGEITLRSDLRPDDPGRVAAIVKATGFFYPDEEQVAVELVEEALAKGQAGSGYHFLLADRDGQSLGYSCFGPIPCTRSAFDLYWIAVHPAAQGLGLGRRLIEASERRVKELGGTRAYVETSGRPQYDPTRAFYEALGYRKAAVLDDFYGPDDAKVLYLKVLA